MSHIADFWRLLRFSFSNWLLISLWSVPQLNFSRRYAVHRTGVFFCSSPISSCNFLNELRIVFLYRWYFQIWREVCCPDLPEVLGPNILTWFELSYFWIAIFSFDVFNCFEYFHFWIVCGLSCTHREKKICLLKKFLYFFGFMLTLSTFFIFLGSNLKKNSLIFLY